MNLKLNKSFFKNKRILNVGSGNDNFGTDFIDLYPMKKNVIKCDVDNDKYPYKKNTFDIVYSRCNFEHLSNPKHFVSEVNRILKPKGYLLLITDNANFFGFALSEGHHLKYKGYGHEDLHFGLYTPEHLETHFRKTFDIIDSGYIGSDILPWRNKNKDNFFKTISNVIGKIKFKYTQRIFNNRVYIICQKSDKK